MKKTNITPQTYKGVNVGRSASSERKNMGTTFCKSTTDTRYTHI